MFLALLLFSPAMAGAVSIDSFEALFEVTEESAVITYTLLPGESGSLEVGLPSNISGLSAGVNGTPVPFEFKEADKKIILQATEGEEVSVSFVSRSILEEGNQRKFFVYNFSPGVRSEKITARLLLPEGGLLSSPADEGSVIPSPENIASDGRRLEINWRFEEQETVFVSFIPQTRFNPWPAIGLLALLILAGAVVWAFKAGKALPAGKEAVGKGVDLRGLAPEEKEVVKALERQAEKELAQSRIKDLTGLSKVKLSRVIARLEKKGLVGKRPYGNTNLVFLERQAEKAD